MLCSVSSLSRNSTGCPTIAAATCGTIAATLLRDGDFLRWRSERATAQSVFHIDQHVRQVAVIDDNRLRLVLAFAARIGRHVDFLRRWGHTGEDARFR